MKYSIVISVISLILATSGCGLLPQTQGATVYVHDTVKIAGPTKTIFDTAWIHDSATVSFHDTVTLTNLIETPQLVPVNALPDTGVIYLYPMGYGKYDDQQVQAAVNRAQNTHQRIRLSSGQFYFNNSVLCYVLSGNDFSQSWCYIEGNAPAKDVNDGNATVVNYNPYVGFAFGIQQGKGCVIKNLLLRGNYRTPSDGFYTRTFDQWADGKSSMVYTAPLAGIVIDPFSDAKYIQNDSTQMYPGFKWAYISGMSRSGSTAIIVDKCAFFGFPVGVLVTAVYQLNGESCEVNDCDFGGTISNVAATQAQAKDNWVHGGVWWGDTHTAVDGVHWGLGHGDGSCSWNVDGVNVAGNVYEFCNITNRTMPAVFENVTDENVWMIGWADKQADGVLAQVVFDKCKFDLVHQQTPPYIWHGAGASFTNTTIRYYDNGPGAAQQRVILNDVGDRLLNCVFSAPPFLLYGGAYVPNTQQWGTIASQSPIGNVVSRNNYDSLAGGWVSTIHLDSTGNWYQSVDTANIVFGTLLITQGVDKIDVTHNRYSLNADWNYALPVGYLNHVTGNKVYFDNPAVWLKDGMAVQIFRAVYKKQ